MFIRFLPIENINKLNRKRLIRLFIGFILFRFYPKFIAFFIDLLPRFSKKYAFLRADCDHFGSWVQVFLSHAYYEKSGENVHLILCAKRGTIGDPWKDYLPKLPLTIIYNEFFQFLISPLFHSKYALDVNGHILIANKSSTFRPIPRLPALTESVIEDYSKYLGENIFEKNFDKKLITEPYVLFYVREGSKWRHSINKSIRNMPEDLAFILLKKIISLNIKIVLIADTPKFYNFDKTNISHISDYKSEDTFNIYKNATAIIGSSSGAVNLPSVILNLPTLTITSCPLYHLDGMYIPPSNSKPFTQEIPIKHKWIVASNLNSPKLLKDAPKLVEYFLSDQNLNSADNKFKNPFKYIYTYVNTKEARFLAASDNANISIY